MTSRPSEGPPAISDLVAEMLRLSAKLDDALGFVHRQAAEWADSENDYRLARAKLVLEAPESTVDVRAAWVDFRTGPQRRRAHLADAMRQAGLEAVRSRRAQLSACQSVANAVRAEIDLGRTGPEVAP